MKIKPDASNVPNDTIVAYQREYSLQRRAVDEATNALRSVLKRAKSDGVNTKAIVAAHQAGRLEPEVVARDLHDQVRYMALRGFPRDQLDMFGKIDADLPEAARADQRAWDAEDAGYQAGRHAQPRDANPFPPGGELAVEWDKGWAAGEAAGQVAAGPGSKNASTRRSRSGRSVDETAPKRGGRRRRGDADGDRAAA